MSKDYKQYEQYLSQYRHSTSTNTVKNIERSGSGDFSTMSDTQIRYELKEPAYSDIEATFKMKYPLQYMQVRKKFEKKIRKLLNANEEAYNT